MGIVIILLLAFCLGVLVGVFAYKHDLKNSPVVLQPISKNENLRDSDTRYEIEYQQRLKEYNRQCEELKKLREDFYKKNPDFPIKTMYMQVIAPPQKICIV